MWNWGLYVPAKDINYLKSEDQQTKPTSKSTENSAVQTKHFKSQIPVTKFYFTT